jgi:class 3 adenylate cyclase
MTGQESISPSAVARSVRRGAQNISNASWLALAILAITVGSLIVTAVVSLTFGEDLAGDVIDGTLETQLTLKAEQVEDLVGAARLQVSALAKGARVVDAAERFARAYSELATGDGSALEAASSDVDAFYRDQFVPALEASIGTTIAWPSLRPTTPEATYLQDLYVAIESPDSSASRLVNDAGDGSAWSEVHREVHPRLLEIIERLGVDDLLLIEPESGVIVYSAAKQPDFATSLDTGPHSGSIIADLVRRVRDGADPGEAILVDMAPYVPALGRPVGFIGAPVMADDSLVGILALRFPLGGLDRVMTSAGGWEGEGLGETGETFLVGSDGRMRSVSRAFVEDPAAYADAVASADSATPTELDSIAGTGTTIVFQKVVAGNVLEDLGSGVEVRVEPSNYLGREVLSAYRPVEVDGVNWYVGAQMGREEIERPISDFRRALLIAVAVFVVFVTFATVAWAGSVFKPLRAIGAALRRIHEGEPQEELERSDRAALEFVELTDSVEAMLDASQTRQRALGAATEQRLQVMRSFLPASVADRLEAGDRRVIDVIAQATIAVVVVHGLGGLLKSGDIGERREQLGILVSELDAVARLHGVEPVKLVGDAYFAGCGLEQPYLDHALRTLAFAVDAREVVREAVPSEELGVAAGLHSGSVTAGLSGSSLLVYDLWGHTVATAQALARSAGPDQILVSDDVRKMLPDSAAVRQWSSGDVEGWEVTSLEAVAERAR